MDEETRRLESASQWLIRFQEDDLLDAEIVSWVQWCEADPRNRRAFERLLPLWQALDAAPLSPDRAAVLASMPQETLAQWREQFERLRSGGAGVPPAGSAGPVHPLRIEATSLDGRLSPHNTLRRAAPSRTRFGAMGLAASVILVIGALGFWRYPLQSLRPTSKLDSAVAQNREATLPDGSSLALGAHSAIAIDFGGVQRSVELSEGEAFFFVKQDKTRPFVVHAGNLRVTALGTSFDVLRTASRVAVTVQEGMVEVRTDSSPGTTPQSVLAPAGHQVVYDSQQRLSPRLRTVDAAAATAWRQGRLEYIEEPLASVVANLNRYSSRHIALRDAEAGRFAYTGTIEVRSIDEWLQALPRIFPVRVAAGPGDQIIIQGRSPGSAVPGSPQ